MADCTYRGHRCLILAPGLVLRLEGEGSPCIERLSPDGSGPLSLPVTAEQAEYLRAADSFAANAKRGLTKEAVKRGLLSVSEIKDVLGQSERGTKPIRGDSAAGETTASCPPKRGSSASSLEGWGDLQSPRSA